MTLVRTRRIVRALLAGALLGIFVLPGIATADPNEDVEELVDDIEQFGTETLPRFIFEDAPESVQWLIDNPPDPDPTPFVEAFSYPQPEEIPGMLEDIVDSAQEWEFALPTRYVVSIHQEPYEEDGSRLVIEEKLYRPGGEYWQNGRTRVETSSCDGIATKRLCRAFEDVSPSEVTVARQTKRTNNETFVEVKAGYVLQGGDKQEHAVSSPAVPCNSPVGPAGCAVVGEVLD